MGRAKEVQKAQKAIEAGTCPLEVLEELKPVMETIQKTYPEVGEGNIGVGSTIFAVKPGAALPASRLHPARRCLAAGRISLLNMRRSANPLQPDQLGACFRS